MEQISLILMIFALVIIVGVNLFVIYPTIKAVEDGKNAVLEMFLAIPKATMRQLRAMSVDRYEYLSKLVKDSNGNEITNTFGTSGDATVDTADNPNGTQKRRRIGLSAFKLAILLRIGIFSVVAGSYFILSHTEALSRYHYRLLQSPQKVNFAEYRIAGVTRLLHLTRSILIADRYVNETAYTKQKKALSEIKLFSDFNSDLIYGSNNEDGGPRNLIPKEAYKSEGHLKLLFEDACYEIKDADKKKACEEFDYGLLNGGLQAGMLKMVFLAKNVVGRFYNYTQTHTLPLNFTELDDLLHYHDWLQLNEYVQHILPQPIDDSLHHYNHELQDDLNHMTLLRLEFLLVLLGTTLGLWIFVFYPLTKTLNSDIMNSNSMILMIPSDIIRSHPAIREFLVKFSKRNTI